MKDPRPLTHALEIGAIRRQSMTLEVVYRHERLAPESGVEFTLMAPSSEAGFWTVCQGPNAIYCNA